MGRPAQPYNKIAIAIMADGKPRTVEELCQDAGIDIATAYEVIRSLTKQHDVRVHSTETRYRLSDAGVRKAVRLKAVDEAKLVARQTATERMRKKREKDRMLTEPPQPKGPCVVQRALASQHPIAAAWSAA